MTGTVTRFAPSPSGRLHLGHAYSALFAEHQVRQDQGDFLLRIEDIDLSRCRPEFEDAIYQDLEWLGLKWDGPVARQSDRMDLYAAALDKLDELGLLYRCVLSRKELGEALSAPHLTPGQGPDGPAITDTDQILGAEETERRIAAGAPFALRLRMTRAVEMVGGLSWRDLDRGPQVAEPEIFGDVILARKDIKTSYHLAVTVDDADQGITLVTRGEDLFAATHIHRLLQALLDLPTPAYRHHKLLTDDAGKRYAKRDKAQTLAELRADGVKPEDLREMLRLT